MRINVPALPGSEIATATATNRGPSAMTSASPTSGTEHTATSPTGVTVSDNAFAARSVTRWTGTSLSIAPNRAEALSVTNASDTRPRRNAASTRLGPSARKRAARRRPMWRCSFIAAATRAERSVSLRQPALGDLNQRSEGGRVADRDLGEVLAIHLDASGLEPLDQPVVRDVVGAGRSVDPGDPQLAELALAGTPVTVGIGQRMQLLLFGFAIQARPLTAVTLRCLEYCAALLLRVYCALHACHESLPISLGSCTGSSSAVQQLLDAGLVVGRHLGATIEPTGALGRLMLEQVPTVGLLAHDLAGPGQPEPLGSAAMGLRLWHMSSFSSALRLSLRVVPPRAPGSVLLVVPAGHLRRAPPWRESSRRGAEPAPSSCFGRPAWRTSRRSRSRRRRRPAAAAAGSPARAATARVRGT